ncbi:MAG: hypothetical protein LBI10_09000 [Deltaproteobacteria bacterium]|nr:hypothetical protein [Deltaproteobacteria bacterium]
MKTPIVTYQNVADVINENARKGGKPLTTRQIRELLGGHGSLTAISTLAKEIANKNNQSFDVEATTVEEPNVVDTKAEDANVVNIQALETKALETKDLETKALETKDLETKALETKDLDSTVVDAKLQRYVNNILQVVKDIVLDYSQNFESNLNANAAELKEATAKLTDLTETYERQSTEHAATLTALKDLSETNERQSTEHAATLEKLADLEAKSLLLETTLEEAKSELDSLRKKGQGAIHEALKAAAFFKGQYEALVGKSRNVNVKDKGPGEPPHGLKPKPTISRAKPILKANKLNLPTPKLLRQVKPGK